MGCKIDDRSNVKSIQRVKLEGPGISSISPERKKRKIKRNRLRRREEHEKQERVTVSEKANVFLGSSEVYRSMTSLLVVFKVCGELKQEIK